MAHASRLAVVTGAGSGIGRGVALSLAAREGPVAVLDLDANSAEETAAMIRKAGGRAMAFQADASAADDLDRAIGGAVEAFGPLEIMVNNAGIIDDSNVDELDEAVWQRVIAVDLTSVVLGSRRALQEMLPRGRGRLINVASVAGLNGTGGGAAYVAAKHGVVGLTRQMAVAYADRGITSNAVCPGPIRTNLNRHSRQILHPGVEAGNQGSMTDEWLHQIVPAGRWGSVEEVASAVCYLASEEAGYITGLAMTVDGGYRAR